MDAARHRIWPYTVLAWFALVAVPTAYAAAQWQMGIGRDPDMSGVGELVLSFLFIVTLPMAALAFGVFAPLALAVDYLVNGRTSRLVNVLLGAVLSAPALFVTVLVTGWPERSMEEVMTARRHPARATGIVAATLVAGMIVGLGLRHREQHGSTRRRMTAT